MMNQKLAFFKKSIKGLLVIGMAVQICLGLIWMCANLFSMQNFEETAGYIEMSRSFVLDEYAGILYPALLFVLRAVAGEGGCYPVLYLIQLTVAFLSNCAFCKMSGLGDKKLFSAKNIFGACYLMTIPFVMQLHMAVMPASLCGSFFLLMIGICMESYRDTIENRQIKKIGCACVLWAVLGLLLPDNIWLGAVPFVWLFGVGIWRKWAKKIWAAFVIGICAVLLVTGVTNTVTRIPGSRGNIQRTLGAALLSRLAWPNFESNYYFWPEEVKQVMPPMTAREIDKYADHVKVLLGPLFEEAFGKEQANTYYWQMALRCFSDRTKEILPRIAEDFLSYLFTPFAIMYHFGGGGYSYAGWNFDRMWQQHRTLTGIYVEYSLYSFSIGMAVVLLYLLIRGIYQRRCRAEKKRLPEKGILVLCLLCMLTQTVWYTMSGTYMMDYKNVPLLLMLWYACILLGEEKC